MPIDTSVKKTLVIGSGPIVIGQAAEFDYAGVQACRILRQEGVNVVLCNSNPATIMTDQNLADEIYLEPLCAETVARIIEKERPDGLLAGLGGQTGLTIAMQLSQDGTLERYGVRLLGSDMNAIRQAEDRELFREAMERIGQPTVPSEIAVTVEEALRAAEKIGYPVIVRPAYTLGGSGGGIADNPAQLEAIAENGLELSPITQVLIEKSIAGWKEIEFETMRGIQRAGIYQPPAGGYGAWRDGVGIRRGRLRQKQNHPHRGRRRRRAHRPSRRNHGLSPVSGQSGGQ